MKNKVEEKRKAFAEWLQFGKGKDMKDIIHTYTMAVSPIRRVADTKKKLRGFKIFALQGLNEGLSHDSSGTAGVPQPTLAS